MKSVYETCIGDVTGPLKWWKFQCWLGTTTATDVLKYHFFEFTTNLQGMAPNLTNYQGILGMFNMYK